MIPGERTYPEIREHVTHTEYYGDKRPMGHIPEARFIYKDGAPVKLDVGTRTYEVKTHTEVLPAREFFQRNTVNYQQTDPHQVTTIEVDTPPLDYNIKSIEFKNPQAALIFKGLTGHYRHNIISYMKSSLAEEIALARADSVGGYDSKLQLGQDRLYADRIVREITQKKGHKDKENIVTLATDSTASLYENLEKKYRSYFPKQSGNNGNTNVFTYKKEDPFQYIPREILGWINHIEEANTQIRIQDTLIETGGSTIVISRVTVGEVVQEDDRRFYLEERVAERMIFAAERMGLGLRSAAGILEINDFDASEISGSSPSSAMVFTKTAGFFGNMGKHMLIINPVRRIPNQLEQQEPQVSYSSHNAIPINVPIEGVNHETGHLVNPYYELTKQQGEGFAVCMEYGFSFREIMMDLAQQTYQKPMTSARLASILSQNPKNITAIETYFVTGAFLSWLFEKLGPERFAQFYGHITGGYYETRETGLNKLKHERKVKDEVRHYKGQLLHCLKDLPKDHRWTWESERHMLKDFTDSFNTTLGEMTRYVHTLPEEYL
ncbi:MAG: hypothetical protein UW82_C0041G0005 [candidate division WWE3 bacterium GW2011_GWC2_44_9]|uniref:Uncharacterized protein n=1 Tax=candidate division WWE3 bacterium GW2011_GWC2_44_9 TaxID=1619125 RepID=A0A0G1NGP5_UNCKA|nr:MAG: hypothetical protein UW82_C0041G0005 [candidate division WWE3 bacterium GW2011_GWC2_44_9]